MNDTIKFKKGENNSMKKRVKKWVALVLAFAMVLGNLGSKELMNVYATSSEELEVSGNDIVIEEIEELNVSGNDIL